MIRPMDMNDLVVDYQKIKQEELAGSLAGLVVFDKSDFEPKLILQNRKISIENKVLVAVAAFQGKSILSGRKLLVQPGYVVRLTSLRGGTVRPTLKKFFEKGLVFKTAEEGYFLTQTGLIALKNISKEVNKDGFHNDSSRR